MSELKKPDVRRGQSRVDCKCGEDLTDEADSIADMNNGVGRMECPHCETEVFFCVVYDEISGEREFDYSFEMFPEVSRVRTDLPRCPACGHEFDWAERYPETGSSPFEKVMWNPADQDYQTEKSATVTCLHCKTDMLVRMTPPERPREKYNTYRQVERVCRTCGKTHLFCVVAATETFWLLRDMWGTWHEQEEPYHDQANQRKKRKGKQ